ncbi:hypothetical protein DUNSADRAFT_17470, partial [Dunaliella salina]
MPLLLAPVPLSFGPAPLLPAPPLSSHSPFHGRFVPSTSVLLRVRSLLVPGMAKLADATGRKAAPAEPQRKRLIIAMVAMQAALTCIGTRNVLDARNVFDTKGKGSLLSDASITIVNVYCTTSHPAAAAAATAAAAAAAAAATAVAAVGAAAVGATAAAVASDVAAGTAMHSAVPAAAPQPVSQQQWRTRRAAEEGAQAQMRCSAGGGGSRMRLAQRGGATWWVWESRGGGRHAGGVRSGRGSIDTTPSKATPTHFNPSTAICVVFEGLGPGAAAAAAAAPMCSDSTMKTTLPAATHPEGRSSPELW